MKHFLSPLVWLLFSLGATAAIFPQTPEALAHAAAKLLEAGALDAWVTPVLMKKGRPGHLVTALAREADVPALEDVFFARRRRSVSDARRRPGRSSTGHT